MAETPIYERWEIQDYTAFNKTQIPLSGELVYFNNIELWIKNVCHVIGDGTKQVQQLPFIETVIIETTLNISLNNYRISGNITLIHNKNASNTIIVNIGTTGTPINYEVKAGDMVLLKFNGVAWIELKKTGGFTLKLSTDYVIQNVENYNNYFITNNSIITLPLLSASQNREPFYIVNADTNLKTIITQGSDNLNGFTKIYLYEHGDYVKVFPTAGQWRIYEQNINYDSGRINTNDWTTRSLGTIVLGYDTLVGTIKIGDIVTGGVSGATGKVIYFTGTNIYLYQVTLGGVFTNNATLTFTGGATALVNEPTGTNKNKDTNIYIWGMGDKIQRIDKKFIIHQADNDTAVIEINQVSYYVSPPNAVWYGTTYFFVGNNELALKSAEYGLDFIAFAGTRLLINTQDWYYRHRFRIRY